MSQKIQIFSSGGGTQSAAITALIVQGRLPKPDFVCIVDTERERATTWQYLDDVIRPALASVGLEVHRINQQWAKSGVWSTTGKTIQIPIWTTQTGEVGKAPGMCSNEWKVRPMQRYMRSLGVATKDQVRWIGFSLDEARRVARMMAREDYESGNIRFPLIHDFPMRRQQAIQLVKDMGWPMPPRSACWMCPNQADDEWTSLTPEEFTLAVALDYKIREDDPFAFLHSSGIPLDKVVFKKEPVTTDGGNYCSSGGCFT